MSLLHSIFGGSERQKTQEIKTVLDLVTYTANLASNPTDIDPLLDPVRKITATHSPGAELSPANEVEVLNVYLALETYLMTRDPIRTFTKEELRNRLDTELASKLAEYETKGGL